MHQAVRDLRNEELAIGHRHVVAVVLVLVQQLVAPETVGRGVAIVLAVDRRDTEAPVDVILLHGVRQPLDIDHRLVELHGVGVVVIGGRRIAASAPCWSKVAAGVDPAVDLDVVFVHPASDAGIAQRRSSAGCRPNSAASRRGWSSHHRATR